MNVTGFGRNILIILSLLIFTTPALSGQSDIGPVNSSEPSAGYEPLPSGFGSIMLGMNIENVKELLLSDPNFVYRGEPDVTMLPQDNRQVIECDGAAFIARGYFQFDQDKLYLITLVLDEETIDHYSVYSSLRSKYGEPAALNPSRTLWRNEDVSISLERPLSIKYIDREVFSRLQKESETDTSFEQQMRQDFLDLF